ncbi:hypothetical protein [Amphibiibacter pelophylacis]|uniref:Uncharacterized protein n=1 Tax=Amphibiibacter pelophylacis TaxID=1799477 RepID=A0ACC6P5G8_9BURK
MGTIAPGELSSSRLVPRRAVLRAVAGFSGSAGAAGAAAGFAASGGAGWAFLRPARTRSSVYAASSNVVVLAEVIEPVPLSGLMAKAGRFAHLLAFFFGYPDLAVFDPLELA